MQNTQWMIRKGTERIIFSQHKHYVSWDKQNAGTWERKPLLNSWVIRLAWNGFTSVLGTHFTGDVKLELPASRWIPKISWNYNWSPHYTNKSLWRKQQLWRAESTLWHHIPTELLPQILTFLNTTPKTPGIPQASIPWLLCDLLSGHLGFPIRAFA